MLHLVLSPTPFFVSMFPFFADLVFVFSIGGYAHKTLAFSFLFFSLKYFSYKVFSIFFVVQLHFENSFN
jgi:hypothetical protein